jgi:hypothetical protein
MSSPFEFSMPAAFAISDHGIDVALRLMSKRQVRASMMVKELQLTVLTLLLLRVLRCPVSQLP